MRVTGTDLAKILGLSKGRVSQLKDDGVLVARSGKYDVAEAVQGYIAFLESGPANAEVAAHRARLIGEQTRRLKLANDEKEGQLIDVEKVRLVMSAGVTGCMNALESVPGRCAATLAAMKEPAEITAYLRREIRQARSVMASGFRKLAIEFDGK